MNFKEKVSRFLCSFKDLEKPIEAFIEKNASDALNCRNEPKYRRRFYRIYSLLFYMIIERSGMFLAENYMSYEQKIIFYDHHLLLLGSSSQSLLVIGTFLNSTHILYRYFLNQDKALLKVILHVLCKKPLHILFKDNKKQLESYPFQYFNYQYHQKTLQLYFNVAIWGSITMYVFDLFLVIFMIQKFVVMSLPIFRSKQLFKLWFYSSIFFTHSSVYYEVFYLIMKYGTYAAISMIFFLYYSKHLFHCLSFEARQKSVDLLSFRKLYTQSMLLFFRINAHFGPNLRDLVIILTPTHAYLLIDMISRDNSFDVSTFAALYTVSIYIFLIHFIFSKLSNMISEPISTLHSKFLFFFPREDFQDQKRKIKTVLLQNRLVISHFISDLCSGYQFTYSSMGHVNVTTFNKFVFIYMKFLVLSYKLLKK